MASSSRYAVSSVEGRSTYHRTLPGATKEYFRRYHRGDQEVGIDDLQTGKTVRRSTSKIVSPSKKGSYTFGGGEFKRNKRNPTTYGTSYFVSMSAAVRYYKDYGDDKEDVQRKIREGSIHIGKPPLKPGERLGLTDGGKRYTITEAQKIPNGRFVPAKVKHNGRTYSGKVKRVNGRVKIYLPPSVVRKINPERRWDIHEIKDANRAAGMHFFDRDTVKLFHSKVFPTVYQGPGGVYFVTSEYRDSPSDREYKVRQFNVSNAAIRTETTYKDQKSAVAHAKRSANR